MNPTNRSNKMSAGPIFLDRGTRPGLYIKPSRVVTKGTGCRNCGSSRRAQSNPGVSRMPSSVNEAMPVISRKIQSQKAILANTAPDDMYGLPTREQKNTTRLYFEAPQLNDSNFDDIIGKINTPIAILFSTRHCGACKDFRATTWQEAYYTYKDKMSFFEFDCGVHTKKDKEHDATSHPTIVFYNKGQDVGSFLGHSHFQYFNDTIRRLNLF